MTEDEKTLQRFADALAGKSGASKKLTAASLQAARTRSASGSTELLRDFYMRWMSSGSVSKLAKEEVHPFFSSLNLVPPVKRAAVVLYALLRLSESDISLILRATPSEVARYIEDGFQALSKKYKPKVYLLEPEPVISLDIERCLEPFGARCTRFNYSVKNVLDDIVRHSPDLIISEARLSSPSDGVALAKAASAKVGCPVIFATAWQEDVGEVQIPAGIYIVGKPFSREHIRAAFIAAFADRLLRAEAATAHGSEVQLAPEISSSELTFTQGVAPLKLVVHDGVVKLRAPEGAPISKIDFTHLTEIVPDIVRDIDRITAVQSNMPPAYFARLQSIRDLITSQMDDAVIIRVGLYSRSLELMKSPAHEIFDGISAADVDGLCDTLSLFVRQFPVWRAFLQEAERESFPEKVGNAVEELVQTIISQPSDVVSDDVKSELKSINSTGFSSSDPVTNKSMRSAVSNIFKSIGLYLKDRSKGAATHFNDTIEKNVGSGVADGLTNLVIASSTMLTALAGLLPAEFGWVGPLIAIARTLRKKH